MNNIWSSPPWWILWIILWVFIWPLFLLLLRKMRGGSGSSKTALSILQERYAKGEISKQEFDEKKRDIS